MKNHSISALRLCLLAGLLLGSAFTLPLASAAEAAPAQPTAAATAAPATAKPTATPPPAASFTTFRILDERNIFDPNRVGRTLRNVEAPPRGDTLAFVGTLQSDKGLVAFFDGSSAGFQKVLHENESIAQYTVTHITNDGVDLSRDGKVISLRVGQKLRRPIGGDWTVIAMESLRTEAPRTDASETNTPAAIPAGASDTLKRLMEQRQKQLK